MLSFLVFGLPRSGTTWAANWLSADRALCFHDAIAYGHPSHLDEVTANEPVPIGISCTASWMFSDWLEGHPAPVLLLDRPLAEINESCARVGLEQINQDIYDQFQALNGLRIPYRKLFDPSTARRVWSYLLPSVPFNSTRHHLLRLMHIDTDLNAWAQYHHVPWNPEGTYDDAERERRHEAIRRLTAGEGLPPSADRIAGLRAYALRGLEPRDGVSPPRGPVEPGQAAGARGPISL